MWLKEVLLFYAIYYFKVCMTIINEPSVLSTCQIYVLRTWISCVRWILSGWRMSSSYHQVKPQNVQWLRFWYVVQIWTLVHWNQYIFFWFNLPWFAYSDSGRLMARYCIAFETMKNISKLEGTETMEELVSQIILERQNRHCQSHNALCLVFNVICYSSLFSATAKSSKTYNWGPMRKEFWICSTKTRIDQPSGKNKYLWLNWHRI